MSDINVQIEGADAAVADVADFAARLPRTLEPVTRTAAQRIASRARASAPVRSGRLAGSIDVGRDPQGATVTMGGGGIPYARWIEYGGSRGRPYVAQGRYLGAAVATEETAVGQDIQNGLSDAIGRYPWTKA
jgi:hypothetical protein